MSPLRPHDLPCKLFCTLRGAAPLLQHEERAAACQHPSYTELCHQDIQIQLRTTGGSGGPYKLGPRLPHRLASEYHKGTLSASGVIVESSADGENTADKWPQRETFGQSIVTTCSFSPTCQGDRSGLFPKIGPPVFDLAISHQPSVRQSPLDLLSFCGPTFSFTSSSS
ncbi:hypothetical protein B0T18DRAFT_386587 [Schizothecium vesticola]|uniref:Uncharacterized protein n=1 Tax=Schizothecium vesticola TaxID=314040 RepID=A0AA40FBJ0_9PEZI|nr:hypothetical protein B0T18DRAFT_386587 [Schizothecium vesticola]